MDDANKIRECVSWIESLSEEAHQKLASAILAFGDVVNDEVPEPDDIDRCHRLLFEARGALRQMRRAYVKPLVDVVQADAAKAYADAAAE